MKYGYLLIERVPRTRLTLPDGSVTDHAADAVEDTVRAWWEANVRDAPAADPAELRAWEEEFTAYRAATTLDEVEGQRGFSSEPVPVTRITYPDGVTDERALGGPPEARIRRRFTAQHPPPAGAEPRSERYDTWRPLADVQVAPATGWRAALVRDGRQEEFDLGARAWEFGVPTVEIVAKLDALAAEGWRVLHVSEDHGVYNGPHAQTDHFVTRARYLLVTD